jgi:RNA polymerase sigma-70 factor (ECF subfamily)
MRADLGPSSAPEPPGDRELVLAFQSGDENSYEQIYLRHADRVRHICRRILGNGQDAEEAAQEAFLRAYVALGRFNGQYQLGAWLARIAANVCFDQLRLRSRTVQTTELGGEATSIASPPTELSVEDQMSIGDAMKDIQPLHGQALFFRAVEGLSHNEIAERLEMSPAQVKALLHRARASFKKAWRSASGWSIAFVWHFRGRIKNVSIGGPDVIASAGPQMSLVAERVATSAVVVALALSGVQGVSGTGRPTGPPARPRVAEAAGSSKHHIAPHSVKDAVAAAAQGSSAPAEPATPADGRRPHLVARLDLPVELPATRARKKEEPKAEKPSERSEDDHPLPAPVRPVVKEAKETLEELPPR